MQSPRIYNIIAQHRRIICKIDRLTSLAGDYDPHLSQYLLSYIIIFYIYSLDTPPDRPNYFFPIWFEMEVWKFIKVYRVGGAPDRHSALDGVV